MSILLLTDNLINTTPWYEVVLNYLDVLKWPIIVIILLLLFKKPLYNLLANLPDIITKFKFQYGKLKAEAKPEDYSKKDEVIVSTEIKSYKEKLTNEILLDLNNLVVSAHDLSRQEKHEVAANELRKVIQISPNRWDFLHNLAVELIRAGKKNNRIDLLIEAEQACRNALFVADRFPYGSFYNLARAQAASGNIIGLRETLNLMQKIDLPENLGLALANEDPDIRITDEIANLKEYKDLIQEMKDKFK